VYIIRGIDLSFPDLIEIGITSYRWKIYRAYEKDIREMGLQSGKKKVELEMGNSIDFLESYW